MRILISGGNGNLGLSLQAVLRQHDLIVADRNNWDLVLSHIDQGIDVIIHCAYDLKNKITKKPSIVLDSNLIVTMRLLELANRIRPTLFSFVSSCAVYGDRGETSEEINCNPLSINGITKLLNEVIIKDYCRENGIGYQIYRVFNMFGGRDNFSIISHLEHSYNSGEPFKLNNQGRSLRDFVHVDDVAKTISLLLSSGNQNEVFNIGTGKATPIFDIVSAFEKRYGKVKLNKMNVDEVAYSCANINKLKKAVKVNYIDIIRYILDGKE